MRDLPALRRVLTLALLMVATVLVSAGAAAAAPRDWVAPVETIPVQETVQETEPEEQPEEQTAEQPEEQFEEHCVAEVAAQESDGELLLTQPRCFGTFAEAISEASDGEVSLGFDAVGSDALTDDGLQSMLADFTIGIHYTGKSGSGSSIVIKGSACKGGWWNTGSTWANKISSSYNGCYRLRHYDYPNKSGMNASTTGAGAVRNLPSSMNNRTESVSYHSS